MSETQRALYGLPPGTHLGYDEWLALVHPDDGPWVEAQLRAAFESGEPLTAEFRILRADDGRLRWIQARGRRLDRPESSLCFVGVSIDITQRRAAKAALAANERRYQALAEAGAVALWRADPHGSVLESSGWKELTDQSQEALRDRGWLQMVHPEDRDRIVAACPERCAEGRPVDEEIRVQTAAAGWRWVRLRCAAVFDETGKPIERVGTVHDVHHRRAAEAALAESEARFARASAVAKMGAWEWDLATDAFHHSPGFEALCGRPPDSLPTMITALGVIHPEDRGAVSAVLERALCGDEGDDYVAEFRVVWLDGTERWLRAQGRVERKADGQPLRLIGVTQDITERRRVEAQIVHMARHDTLTDLPNRTLFRERLEQVLARCQSGDTCAVLCLDLDRFKAVNNTLGHPAGDRLLRAMAARLRLCIRETDTAARISGDEFAIVQRSVDQTRDATVLAQRLIDRLSQPYDIDGLQIVIGASVGIAIAPGDGTDPDLLLRNADLALYRAKVEGRGRYRFFEPEIDARMQVRRSLELDLCKALAGGEFELYYQPLVNLTARRIIGFEALLRWRHPTRGLLSPDVFVPLAEEMGLIVPIGEWVMAKACIEAASWRADLKVAVNLSPAQFMSRSLVQAVASALESSGLPPGRLELEITETVLLQETEGTLTTLHRLRDLGAAITIDDFGTGYSSLSYLRRFPFDRVKIDRSFISELGPEGSCATIVRAILGLCASLGMRTTAEGVETEAQLEWITTEGCTEAQGYLFGPPRPAAQVPVLLAAPLGAVQNVATARASRLPPTGDR